MFTGKHLYEFNHPGDSKLNLFRNQWIHTLSAMREDDKPTELALRDILYDKIKGSSSMAFDLRYYRNLSENKSEKSYDYLMEMMARTVSVEREERNRLDKAKGINQLMGSKALAVENTTKKEEKPKPTPKAKADAAPVLTKPNPKMHNEQEKGKGKYEKGKVKGKGKEKSRERSPSQDRKSIPCIYYFQKGGCSKVRIVPSVTPRRRHLVVPVLDPGMGGNPKNDRTPSPKPKSEKPCFLYAKGKCDRADCPYKYDNEAAPAENGSAKAKAAAPTGKAKAATAKAKSAAVVVQVNRENDNGYLSDWSGAEDSSTVAAGKALKKKSLNHVRKGKMVSKDKVET